MRVSKKKKNNASLSYVIWYFQTDFTRTLANM